MRELQTLMTEEKNAALQSKTATPKVAKKPAKKTK